MKIAISSSGETLDSMVDQRFGRCPYFIIADIENNELKGLESVKNTGMQTTRGAGVTAAQIVANKESDAVITGNVGPNAYNMLTQSNIKIFAGVTGVSVRKALEMYIKGEIQESTTPSPPTNL